MAHDLLLSLKQFCCQSKPLNEIFFIVHGRSNIVLVTKKLHLEIETFGRMNGPQYIGERFGKLVFDQELLNVCLGHDASLILYDRIKLDDGMKFGHCFSNLRGKITTTIERWRLQNEFL